MTPRRMLFLPVNTEADGKFNFCSDIHQGRYRTFFSSLRDVSDQASPAGVLRKRWSSEGGDLCLRHYLKCPLHQGCHMGLSRTGRMYKHYPGGHSNAGAIWRSKPGHNCRRVRSCRIVVPARPLQDVHTCFSARIYPALCVFLNRPTARPSMKHR